MLELQVWNILLNLAKQKINLNGTKELNGWQVLIPEENNSYLRTQMYCHI